MELDKESGRYVLDIKLPLDSKALQAAHTARFTYNVYEEFERASIARDTLEVVSGEKPAPPALLREAGLMRWASLTAR